MKSFMSKFAWTVIRMSDVKGMYDSPKRTAKHLERLRKNSSRTVHMQYPMFCRTRQERVLGSQVFYINEQSNPQHVVLYMHGGGYCEPPVLPHWQFMSQLTRETGAEVIFPVYPRGPVHTYKETYTLMETIYRSLLQTVPPERIIFMGDSSGGGLALAFAEYLKTQSLPEPGRLFLFSPWVDMSMENPDIVKRGLNLSDPSLGFYGVLEMGKAWAGGDDLHNPMLSPLFGDLHGLPETTMFIGTHELLYPDAMLLEKKAKEQGLRFNSFVYDGMNHVFIYYPTPEGRVAKHQVYHMINNI